MKTWEDTVIVECICDAYGHEPFHSPPNILGQEDKEWHHCYECDASNRGKKAQAKASYEAGLQEGRKEVVEFFERTRKQRLPKYQLKEWGLEG